MPEESTYRIWLVGLLFFGWLSLPAGFLVSLTSWKQRLKLVSWVGYIWMGFFHLLFFSSLFEFILSLLFEHAFSYWNLFFSLVIGIYALFKGLSLPRVITHQLKGPAAMRGFSVVQISDLHIGLLHLNAAWLAKVVQRVNTQNADVFVITGDLVEGPFAEVSPQLEVLKNVKPRLEKFYVTGNHEYIHGASSQPGDTHSWETRLRALGFTTLHNENKVVRYLARDASAKIRDDVRVNGDGHEGFTAATSTAAEARVLFAGVPDRMVPRFNPSLSSKPDEALQTIEKVDYKILLAHEPASRWDLKNETCDLILSGHTHGGQIFPFGLLVRIVQPVVKGFKQMGSVLVFAHQGTGLWGPPMRWFSRGEIVVFKWV